MYVYDDDNNVNRVIWKPRNRYPKAEKTFQKWKSTHSSIWQQNQLKCPKSLYICLVVELSLLHLFLALRTFWFLEKPAVTQNSCYWDRFLEGRKLEEILTKLSE